jgi:hypothetical protein
MPGTVLDSRILHNISAQNVLSSHDRIENRRSKESWEADGDCAQNITYNSTVYFQRQPSPCLFGTSRGRGLGYNPLYLLVLFVSVRSMANCVLNQTVPISQTEAQCAHVNFPWFYSDRNQDCWLSCNVATKISACLHWNWEWRLLPLFFNSTLIYFTVLSVPEDDIASNGSTCEWNTEMNAVST